MRKTKEINIDTVTPSSLALLTDQREQVVLQHGGVVTRVGFDSVYAMSVEDFIKYEVPKITEARKSDELRVLRDSATQQLSLIYGDQVIQYHVTGLDECSINQLTELLCTKDKLVRVFNFARPLVSYVEDGSYNIVTVYVEEQKRELTFGLPGGRLTTTAYLPPAWFKVTLNQSNSVMSSAIAAVPERSVRAEDTVLHHIALPNVGGGGSICMGSSHLTSKGYFGDNPTLSQAVESAIMQFFGSVFNLDLYGYVQTLFCAKEYEALPKLEKFESRMGGCSKEKKTLLQILRIYSMPGGWRKVTLPLLPSYGYGQIIEAREFLGTVR